MPVTARPACAPIRADEAYPMPLFLEMTGLGGHAFRRAVANGLRTAQVGNRKFILGRDWLEHLERVREQGPIAE